MGIHVQEKPLPCFRVPLSCRPDRSALMPDGGDGRLCAPTPPHPAASPTYPPRHPRQPRQPLPKTRTPKIRAGVWVRRREKQKDAKNKDAT